MIVAREIYFTISLLAFNCFRPLPFPSIQSSSISHLLRTVDVEHFSFRLYRLYRAISISVCQIEKFICFMLSAMNNLFLFSSHTRAFFRFFFLFARMTRSISIYFCFTASTVCSQEQVLHENRPTTK